jgi:hypothetical protein
MLLEISFGWFLAKFCQNENTVLDFMQKTKSNIIVEDETSAV